MGEIKVPASLLPENIMATVEQKIKKERRKKKGKRIAVLSVLVTAAAAALITTAYFKFFNTNYGETEGSISGLNRVKSYQALYNYMKYSQSMNGVPQGGLKFDVSEDMNDGNMNAGDMNSGNMSTGMGELKEETDYSDTNIQTQGIDEGDIIKTDGNYIYVIKDKAKIAVLKADGENTAKVSEIDVEGAILEKYQGKAAGNTFNIIETYLCEDKLIVISGDNEAADNVKHMVYAAAVDLKEGKAGDINLMCQEGDYYDSRMKDGILYLVTDKAMNYYSVDSVDDVKVMVDDDSVAKEDTFYTSVNPYYNDYFIMSSADTEKSMEVISTKAYIGGNVQMYVSSEHIYFLEGRDYGQNTNIVSFSFDNGNIEPKVSGCVDGYVNDSFSADEYNGFLRLVTTTWNDGNNLYVLNDKLEVVGSITGLAEGEEIKSARFMGDMGYFVTYRNTDPLFTVDLSNPSEPKLTDELKITGYSAYLHFIDEDKLLGIGYESNPDTGIENGIKVTLFDVSDKTDVKVKTNLKYEGGGIDAESVYNHKAVLAADSRGIYGFCLYLSDYGADYEAFVDEEWNEVGMSYELLYQYKVFLYEDGDIREVESIEKSWGSDDYFAVRGLYAGDYFYLADGDEVYVYSLDEVLSDDVAEELLSVSY